MPIKPEFRHHYSKKSGWPLIRALVLERATDSAGVQRCELCDVANHHLVMRLEGAHLKALERWEPGATKIVLTVAHINQNPVDVRMCNLDACPDRIWPHSD